MHQNHFGMNMIMTFHNCTVSFQDQILFEPSWGVYDMAVGEKIISVFSGPSDIPAFDNEPYVPKETTHKIDYSKERLRLHELYQKVRDSRESGDQSNLPDIWQELKKQQSQDWLCPLEILQIVKDDQLKKEIRFYLEEKLNSDKEHAKLIEDGLSLIV